MSDHPRLIDMRSLQKPEGPPKSGLARNGKLVQRKPEDVIDLVLHQTACVLGVAPFQVKAAGGDVVLAKHRRALGVHAHVTAFTTGKFVAAYPLSAYVWHSNGANPTSIGLEVEGSYNGQPGGKLAEPSDETIEAARAAVRWIVEAAASEGMAIRRVLAHRQFSSSRRADPGWRIWQDVALWADRELGLTTTPWRVDRGGRPIPECWDARQRGIPY